VFSYQPNLRGIRCIPCYDALSTAVHCLGENVGRGFETERHHFYAQPGHFRLAFVISRLCVSLSGDSNAMVAPPTFPKNLDCGGRHRSDSIAEVLNCHSVYVRRSTDVVDICFRTKTPQRPRARAWRTSLMVRPHMHGRSEHSHRFGTRGPQFDQSLDVKADAVIAAARIPLMKPPLSWGLRWPRRPCVPITMRSALQLQASSTIVSEIRLGETGRLTSRQAHRTSSASNRRAAMDDRV